MSSLVYNIIMNTLNGIIVSVAYVILRDKLNWEYIWKALAIMVVPNFLIIFFKIPDQYQMPLVMIIFVTGLRVILKEKIIKALFTFVFILCLGIIYNIPYEFLLIPLQPILGTYIATVIIMVFLNIVFLFLTYMIAKRLRRIDFSFIKKKRFSITLGIILFFGLTISEIAIFFVLGNNSLGISPYYTGILFSILGTMIVSVTMLFLFLNWRNQKKDIQILQQKQLLDQNIAYSKMLEDISDNIRKFKHDYKNILLSLEGYFNEGDMEGLRTYYSKNINEIRDSIERDDSMIITLSLIKDISIKGVLSAKIQHAQSMGIKVNLQLSGEIEPNGINSIDFCRIIGILFDNAIEAAEMVDHGNIHIFLGQNGGETQLILKNSYTGQIKNEDILNEGFSTKGEDRGHGIASMRSILKSYPKISYEWDLSYNLFGFNLSIPE